MVMSLWQQFLSYLIHLASALAMVGAFVAIYLRVTPFAEIALIRAGNVAASLSLGGAILGFGLTAASAIIHSVNFQIFLLWGWSSLIVQVLTYAVFSRIIPGLNDYLEDNNIAVGALLGTASLAVGLINAASLS